MQSGGVLPQPVRISQPVISYPIFLYYIYHHVLSSCAGSFSFLKCCENRKYDAAQRTITELAVLVERTGSSILEDVYVMVVVHSWASVLEQGYKEKAKMLFLHISRVCSTCV